MRGEAHFILWSLATLLGVAGTVAFVLAEGRVLLKRSSLLYLAVAMLLVALAEWGVSALA